jgi:hypothetical protein
MRFEKRQEAIVEALAQQPLTLERAKPGFTF